MSFKLLKSYDTLQHLWGTATFTSAAGSNAQAGLDMSYAHYCWVILRYFGPQHIILKMQTRIILILSSYT